MGSFILILVGLMLAASPRSSKGKSRRQKSSRSDLRSTLTGRDFAPSEMPPVLKLTPWNQVSLRIRKPAGKDAPALISVDDLTTIYFK
jgi:hypothetical protein